MECSHLQIGRGTKHHQGMNLILLQVAIMRMVANSKLYNLQITLIHCIMNYYIYTCIRQSNCHFQFNNQIFSLQLCKIITFSVSIRITCFSGTTTMYICVMEMIFRVYKWTALKYELHRQTEILLVHTIYWYMMYGACLCIQ